jgi:nucleoside-diphosphate-sugar epimerase
MKVLLIGATGNVGLRLVAALLTHNHKVTVYVRSSHKLESLLPTSIFSRLTVVEGDATDSTAIQRAILDKNCEGVVNSAGVAAVAPWASTTLPEIFRAVVKAVVAAGEERGKPLRAWFMGGLGVLCFPGTEAMLSN